MIVLHLMIAIFYNTLANCLAKPLFLLFRRIYTLWCRLLSSIWKTAIIVPILKGLYNAGAQLLQTNFFDMYGSQDL